LHEIIPESELHAQGMHEIAAADFASAPELRQVQA
jgi:hypothetical protein